MSEPRAKGIRLVTLRDTGSFEPTRTLVLLISGAYPNGISFNFCPFCGGKIGQPLRINT